MRRGPTLGRRRILGMGLAAAIGAGAGFLGRLIPRKPLRWTRSRAFPDAAVTLKIQLPTRWSGQASVTLLLEGPEGKRSLPGGTVLLKEGTGEEVLCLTYPHQGRVPGLYRYHAEVHVGSRSWRTSAPVSYSLRKAAWFS